MIPEINPVIRLIQPADNPHICRVIIDVLTEHGAVGEGYAYNDPETQEMYRYYQTLDSRYWVIEDEATGEILGGGGFARLKGTDPELGMCELQKLYFLPKTRGLGLGKKLMALILDEAAKAGFQEMYLETIPQMEAAQAVYKKFGFDYIDGHRGDTGHWQKCQVYMTRSLALPAALH